MSERRITPDIQATAAADLDFSNTEIAFSALDDLALWRTWTIFKAMSSNMLVTAGPKLVEAALKLRLPVTWAIKPTLFQHFCGGTSIEGCEDRVAALHRYGVETILDYSVESVADEAGFDAAAAEVERTIHRARDAEEMAFCVFKATGIGSAKVLEVVTAAIRTVAGSGRLDPELFQKRLPSLVTGDELAAWQKIEARVAKLCAEAAAAHVRILIDAEESWIQDAIDFLAEREMRRHNKSKAFVYTTLQLYRHDQLNHLRTLAEDAKKEGFVAGCKLVRGAYMNKERARAKAMGYASPIQSTKNDTDRDFDEALKFCVANINVVHLCAGTHNEASCKLLTKLMGEAKIRRSDPRVQFAQLLGMSDHLTWNLAHHGYKTAKYVPYGPVEAVLPYLFRRAEENTSIAGQTTRELRMIELEIKRRRDSSKHKNTPKRKKTQRNPTKDAAGRQRSSHGTFQEN